MKRNLIFLIIMIFSLLLIAGCSEKSGGTPDQDDSEAAGLTSFNTQDIYGEDKNQDIFKDYTLTMVNVWGTFCGPCVDEMPYLGELQKEYESKGINIVGIVIDVQDQDLQVIEEQLDLAKEIAESTGADYTHLIVSEEMLKSVLSEFDSIPASFFVDSQGNIVSEYYIGGRSKEDWVDIIEENVENQ